MAIVTKLDEIMKERGYTLYKLAQEVGITAVNLSHIKSGNISSIRFSTLNEICKTLKCTPGDILKYEDLEKKNVIPLFLDYSGTTDLLLKGGAENVKTFFDSIIAMQRKSDCEVRIIMVTGSAFESARSKYKLLNELAENYGLPDLFDSAIAEYCGFLIKKDKSEKLLTLDTKILDNKSKIESIISKYGGKINPDVTSLYNVMFDEISRIDLSIASEEIDAVMDSEDIETITYYDEYGKECDIKPKRHSKSEAVLMIAERLNKKYNIPFLIIGGDSQEEDLKMYTKNKKKINELGIETVFIAPSNIGALAQDDKNIIVGSWKNSNGIAQCIQNLTSRIKVKEEGGIEI